ncbi:MAG: hypothetical protein ACSLE2_19140 [Lysobacterales bacterium]
MIFIPVDAITERVGQYLLGCFWSKFIRLFLVETVQSGYRLKIRMLEIETTGPGGVTDGDNRRLIAGDGAPRATKVHW